MIRDFGFSEWRGGVWTLDLAATGVSATRTAIREIRLRPVMGSVIGVLAIVLPLTVL